MENKYNSIKKLIELWETYEFETDQQDLLNFAEWFTGVLKKVWLNLKRVG